MPNEILLLFRAALELLFLLVIAKFDRAWLYVYIVVNLLLITVIGTKLIPVFGSLSNAGNIFYAATFLAVYLLIEYYGARKTYGVVWVGGAAILLFIVMFRLVASAGGVPEFFAFDQAIAILSRQSARIALASGFGFIISQSINIWLYDWLRRKFLQRSFYLATNVSNILVQIIDSLLFFSIAFLGAVSFADVWQTMLVGYLMKVAFVLVATPFLALQLPQVKKKE